MSTSTPPVTDPVAPDQHRRPGSPWRGRGGRILTVALLSVFVLFVFLPVYWMVITALRPAGEVFTYPPELWPSSFTLDNFRAFFESPRLLRYLANSVLVATATTVGSLAVSTFAGYSFSKFRYRGRRSLMYMILSAQMFPQALLLISIYVLFDRLDILNTYLALVLSFTTFTLPLCTWMLKNFFDTIPTEILDASKIDGASRWDTIRHVLLPMAVPGFVATGLFAFIRGWNDFIFALTLAGPEQQTLPPGLVLTFLSEFQSAGTWAQVMAASLITSLPLALIFMSLQKYFIEGMTAGGLKG